MKIYAVLLAAGTGSRTGFAMPKQLIKINGKEIILRSLEIFLKSKINFEAVIITTPPSSVFKFNWNDFFEKNLREDEMKKLRIITGGGTRQQSVDNSIKYLEGIVAGEDMEKENAVVFIHDSARPFVTEAELHLLLDKTVSHGAAFLCSDVTETIKEINPENKNEITLSNPIKLKTIKRDYLISAKTPQVFKFKLIERALVKATAENFISTDDISLLENLGLTAVPITATDMNMKITSAIDIEIAELLLNRFDKLSDANLSGNKGN
ncbi:MAG: 2-C-methyl-D-erythritol 4-phosphate cytidylyltransferase [Deltaproteobacteria bacterium]|jgi:2-C-methyl-D-erythritol 4-phosphate cytidylyltransferase|nr:2-C-methyl-D-erythritol 4-phosphate cytidylyltransferase [Deltaproteobacteria bacterium]